MDTLSHNQPFPSSRKGENVKIHIDLPHGKIDIEREPMDPYKFYTVCWAIVICIVVVSFFGIFK